MLKTAIFQITAEGRDQGKTFFLQEMPARAVDRWERNAMAYIVNAGLPIEAEIRDFSFGILFAIGIRGILGAHGPEVEALHDELLSCVLAMPDPSQPAVKRPLVDTDTEETATLRTLKDEVIRLHSGFSIADFLRPRLAEAAATARASLSMPTPAQSSGQ